MSKRRKLVKWTKGAMSKEAKKYYTKTQFRKEANGAYQVACRMGIIDEICKHMVSPHVPKGHWQARDNCLEAAKSCLIISEFISKFSGAFQSAKKHNWLDDIYAVMETRQKYPGYWNFENCRNEALYYDNRTDFMRKSSGAYASALKNGWLDDICAHMKKKQVPKGHWQIFSNCREEALKHSSRSEFKDNAGRAYFVACEKGWIDDICSHMEAVSEYPYGYWQSKENCHQEAKKYNTKVDFMTHSAGAYQSAHKNGWIDDICTHMKPNPDYHLRYAYSIEFPELNMVYVGITYNLKKRKSQHLTINDGKCTSSNKHVKLYVEKKEKFIWREHHNTASKENAHQLESDIRDSYTESGWIILNIVKTGGLGGNTIKWTKPKIIQEAKKYDKISDLICHGKGAYDAAKRNNWLPDVEKIMNYENNRPNYWTFNRCKEEAKKYQYRSEFQRNSPSAYSKAHKNGWLNKICSHMQLINKPAGYWTHDNCIIEAKKYKRMTDLIRNAAGAYDAVIRNGWIDSIRNLYNKKPNWKTKEKCQSAAIQFESITAFEKKYPGAYRSAYKNGWLSDITQHMLRPYGGK